MGTSPKYYKTLDPEPINVIRAWGLSYELGNALKYISRAGRKPGETERTALEKAIEYLQFRLDDLPTHDNVRGENGEEWGAVEEDSKTTLWRFYYDGHERVVSDMVYDKHYKLYRGFERMRGGYESGGMKSYKPEKIQASATNALPPSYARFPATTSR